MDLRQNKRQPLHPPDDIEHVTRNSDRDVAAPEAQDKRLIYEDCAGYM
jgi:hypothetical protein